MFYFDQAAVHYLMEIVLSIFIDIAIIYCAVSM